MPTRDEIKQELLRLLGESPFRQARPEEWAYVSAYQLFNKLPAEIQDELAARGSSGRGGGWYDSGAKAISKMLMEMSGQVESAV